MSYDRIWPCFVSSVETVGVERIFLHFTATVLFTVSHPVRTKGLRCKLVFMGVGVRVGVKLSQLTPPCGFVLFKPSNAGSVSGSVTTKINHKEENTNTPHVRSINFMFMLLSERRNRSRWSG